MNRLIAGLFSICLLCSLHACSNTSQYAQPTNPAQLTQPVAAEPAIQPEPSATPSSYTGDNEELHRAFDLGFVPESMRDNWDKTITYSQFCELIDRMISMQDHGLADAWKASAKTAFHSDKDMMRDSGMVGLYSAAKIMGIAEYREKTDAAWYELHKKIGEPWKDFCHEYNPFGITGNMETVFSENEFGYEEASYFYSLSRISLTSGKALFDYDDKTNSMRPGDPLTQEEAICAVLRLYESIYKPTVVSGSVLPKESDKNKDIAVYQYLTSGTENTFFITFGSPDKAYPNAGELNVSYDLMIPKGHETYNGLSLVSCINAVDANGVWLDRTTEDFEASFRVDKGRLALVGKNGAVSNIAEDKGNYWLFHIDIRSSFAATSGKSYQQLYLENDFVVDENGYAGQVWIDNVIIADEYMVLIDYDFNSQYSKPYGEILTTEKNDGIDSCCLLWGPVNKIGTKQVLNVVKSSLVYEGSPNEENNAKLLNGIDTDLLMNPGFDFRNFTGITLRWEKDHTLTEKVNASFDIIAPKELFDGFRSKNSYWLINMAVVSADDRDEILYDRMIGQEGNPVILKKDSFGNIHPITNLDFTQMIEYDDCYKISINATLQWPETSGTRVWMKIQITGSEIVYNGYVYLDNWRISCGDTTLVDYTVEPKPLPDNLYQMYNHSCNGSYYWWNSIGTGFYYLGFDTLNLPE